MTETERDLSVGLNNLFIISMVLLLFIVLTGSYSQDRNKELEKRIIKLEKRK